MVEYKTGYKTIKKILELIDEDSLTIQKIALKLNMNYKGISGILRELEKKEIVKKELDNLDIRYKKVIITEKGKELLNSLKKVICILE